MKRYKTNYTENIVWKRCELLGEYLITFNSTVRDAALYFGISKSTVHKDVTDRLQCVNAELAENVRKLLEKNKSERHIRGGLATRKKYKMQKLAADRTE